MGPIRFALIVSLVLTSCVQPAPSHPPGPEEPDPPATGGQSGGGTGGGKAGSGGAAGRGGQSGGAGQGGAGPGGAGGGQSQVDAGPGGSGGNSEADASTDRGRADGKPSTTDGSIASDSAPPPPAGVCDFPSTRKVPVSSAAALKSALAAAKAGDMIELASGTYSGQFALAASGQSGKPIVLCGPKGAILDAADKGYTLHVTGSRIVMSGFTARGGLKSVMLDGSSDDILSDLEITGSQQEGLHFRMGSARNILRNSYIHDTGKGDPSFGEGVYIGTSGGNDASDENQILDNRISKTAAECIDVKEGTSRGRIAGNTFDGTGIEGENFADSWIDIKGNGYIVENNHGTKSPKDGFQIHMVDGGWGKDNVLRGNIAEGPGSGSGFWVQVNSTGNVISCDNKIIGSWGAGLSNQACKN